MSENEAFKMEIHKNTFYRDKFRKMMKLIVLMLVCCVFLILVFLMQSLHRSEVRYFGSTTSGEQIPVHALSDPVITEKLVIQWADVAAKNAYHLDFNSYESQLEAAKKYFTTTGWKSFNDALSASGLLDAVKEKKLEIDSVVTDDPVIKKTGLRHGVRFWVVQMPILISFDSASANASRKMIITMTVVRSSDIEAPSGLQVETFSTTFG